MRQIIELSSISTVHEVLGLEKPKHPLVSLIQLDEEMIDKVCKEVKYVIDFYQVLMKEGDDIACIYGNHHLDFQEGSLVFLKPGQTLQEGEKREGRRGSGWLLLFHKDLIRRSALGRDIDQYTFFEYDSHEALNLSENEKKTLISIVNKIEEEYSQNIDRHSQEIIIANIEMLLKYSRRYYDRQFFTRSILTKDTLSEFNRLIREYYTSDAPFENGVLTVRECASKMNFSVTYLGDLIKAKTGKSAKSIIQDYAIDQAKTKLVGSKESISQIAFGLGFEYPQSLNKIFKARVGMSPTQYRNMD